MQETVQYILIILGSLGLFLYGMTCMSNALQRLAGARMRHAVTSKASSTMQCLTTGAFITSVIPSSSAVTIMIISFVNAGLVSLRQAMNIIMGANIGSTTMTWLIAIFGFHFSIGVEYIIPAFGLGFVLSLIKKERIKSTGNTLIGLSLMFLAIFFLKYASELTHQSEQIASFFEGTADHGVITIIGFFLIGVLLNSFIQSSSATTTLTMVMCLNGWISFACGIAVILGQNVGRASAALIVMKLTSRNAQFTSMFQFIFNTTGTLLLLPIMPLIIKLIAQLTLLLTGQSPLESPMVTPIGLSIFHTLFNITTIAILIGFIPRIERFVNRLIKSDLTQESKDKLVYIDSRILTTGDISIVQAQREMVKYARGVTKMFNNVKGLSKEHNNDNFQQLYGKVEKMEAVNITRRNELYDFLSSAAKVDIGSDTKHNIEIMFRIISDIEIVSDYNYTFAKLLKTKKERNIWFDSKLRERTNEMFDLTEQALLVMNNNLNNAFSNTNYIDGTAEIKQKILSLKVKLRDELLNSSIEDTEDRTRKAELIFSDLITRMEQHAEVILNISENTKLIKKVNEKNSANTKR